MDANLKTKWVEALRSGEYEQGHGSLKTGDKFCCLGVLCKVAGLEIHNDFGSGNTVIVDGQNCGYGPIRNLLGGNEIASDLYHLNDGMAPFHRHTFAEIADVIERKL